MYATYITYKGQPGADPGYSMRIESKEVSLGSVKLDLLGKRERKIGATRIPEPVRSHWSV